LLLAFPRPEAGRAGADAERGERALLAAHDDDREAGERAVRDELLRACQDVAAVLAARAASRADRVRARARLGERPAPETFATRQRRQPASALPGRPPHGDAARTGRCGRGGP